jgi:hypothetical protein
MDFIQAPTKGKLRWLDASHKFNAAGLINKGYETVDRAAGLGTCLPTTHNRGGNGQSFKAYGALLPISVREWFDSAAEPNDFGGRAWEFCPVFRAPDLPSEKMTPVKIIAWIETVLNLGELKPSGTQQLFENPAKLVKLGYRLAKMAGRFHGRNSVQFIAALCLVGLGTLGLESDQRCERCFRRATPGLTRCRIHSQSKLVADVASNSRSTKIQMSRVASQTLKELNWINSPIHKLQNINTQYRAAAGILWNFTRADEVFWKIHLCETLSVAPLVCKLLPPDFLSLHYGEQLSHLRSAIDENEWITAAWFIKILAAECWLTVEQLYRPGHAGRSELNVHRVFQANEWLASGVRHSEIAGQLGISKSHLSQLLRRSRSDS